MASNSHGVAAVSALPDEIMKTIASKLDLENFHRFGAVCKSWRSISVDIKGYKLQLAQSVPWLMFSSSSSSSGYDRFFNLPRNKICTLEWPLEVDDGIMCCGSNWGWLIMEGKNEVYFLFNPLTRLRINLPPGANLPVLPNQISNRIMKAILLSSPVAIANNSNTSTSMASGYGGAVVALYDCNSLAFCRPGDEMWTAIGHCDDWIQDFIFFSGNLYAITSPRMNLMLVELAPNPRFISCNVTPLPPPVPAELATTNTIIYDSQFHLVESLGELLAIQRISIRKDSLRNCKMNIFKIFKLDLKGRCWTDVEDLDDQILFIDWKGSVLSLSASDYPGFKGNCIYFTTNSFCKTLSDHVTMHNHPEAFDFGVYYLEDKHCKYFSSFCEQMSMPVPSLFTPYSC